MRGRRRLTLAALLLALLAVGACSLRRTLLLHLPPLYARLTQPIAENRPIDWQQGPRTGAAERPPNVVVILADDMGWNDASLHGGVAGGRVPTPHIDSLARDGVHFVRGYAANAVCAPSRASILTGRYSTRFGFEFTPTPKGMATMVDVFYDGKDLRMPVVDRKAARAMPEMGELGMRPEEITLAELLRERGYHTVHIGKWHLGRSPQFRPSAQGFDESLFMENGLYLPVDHPEAVNSRQDFDPIDVFLWANMRYAASFNDSEPFEPRGYLTDYYTDEAVRAIEANRHRPFLLYLAHWAPHTPLQALRSDYEALDHVEGHTLRVYGSMIRAVDRSVGRVLAALEANGLAENTLVFFTSDNGGAHYVGLPELNRPFRGWKLTLFEGGTRVPFLARWPGRIPAGLHYEAPVSHVDLFATAAAAAGAPLPDDRVMDSVDLLPFLRGEAEGEPHRAIFWREGDYQAVLADGWKLQVSKRRSWLFHLERDPTEQQDLYAERADKVRELQALLDAHNAEQSAPDWPSFVELPIPVDKTLADPQEPDDEVVYWPN